MIGPDFGCSFTDKYLCIKHVNFSLVSTSCLNKLRSGAIFGIRFSEEVLKPSYCWDVWWVRVSCFLRWLYGAATSSSCMAVEKFVIFNSCTGLLGQSNTSWSSSLSTLILNFLFWPPMKSYTLLFPLISYLLISALSTFCGYTLIFMCFSELLVLWFRLS